jgi:hypothetical protein
MTPESVKEVFNENLEAMCDGPTFEEVAAKLKPSTKEQRVLEALNKMDQPRLGAVADLSKVDKDTFKKLHQTHGYEIIAAGWIRKLPTK